MGWPKHTGKSLFDAARLLTRPFYWLSDEHDARSYRGGASLFVIRSDRKLFGVTAKHAVDDFLKSTPIGVIPRIYNYPFDLTKRLIANKFDVTTFDLTGYDANKMVILPLRWPPLTPIEGRGVVVVGCLMARHRIEIGRRRLVWDKLCNPLVATRVRGNMVEVEIDARELGRPKKWSDLTEVPYGFSGCPLLTVTQDRAQPLVIGGVITNFRVIDKDRGCFEARSLAPIMRDDGTFY